MRLKIIAEAGVNHNGDMKIAKKLISNLNNIETIAIRPQHVSITDDNNYDLDFQFRFLTLCPILAENKNHHERKQYSL